MDNNQNTFTLKLQEFDQEYEQLKKQIINCKKGDINTIRQEAIRLKAEYDKNNIMLKNRIDCSRSPAASKLAAAQLDYNKNTIDILEANSLDTDESAALYAEYAIDFASQAMRHSLLAVLNAAELQSK